MRILVILGLLLWLSIALPSLAQDDYPPCWESELRLNRVSVQFYEIYFSLLSKVETVDDLVDFAEGYLEYRERDSASTDRCAESIELMWLAQRELSLRAAYQAVDYGLRAKTDLDPTVLAQVNPLSAVPANPFYPDGFANTVNRIETLANHRGRQYSLSPTQGNLPACTITEMASLRLVMPDYQAVMDAANMITSIDQLLTLAEMQLNWRKQWAPDNVTRYEDGRLSLTPRDGLNLLPACSEAAELLWLMNLNVNDASSRAALALAGFYYASNPYRRTLDENTGKLRILIDRIESAQNAPRGQIRRWTTCSDPQRAALKNRLPELTAFVQTEAPWQSADAYLEYVEDGLTWRDELWSSLPDCADALELALMFSQYASDLRAHLAYWWAHVPNEQNPFTREIEVGEFIIDGYGAGLVGGSAVRPPPPRLPICAEADFETLTVLNAEYDIFTEAMTDLGNKADFLDFAGALFTWRDDLPIRLPKCGEAFEIGLLISHQADDFIGLMGLTYAGFGRDTNPYIEPFQKTASELTLQLRALPIKRGQNEIAWHYGGQLNACDGEELALLGQLLSDYLDLLETGQQISSLEGLAAFGDAQIAWRTDMWPRLPNCAEAFEIGLHIYRTASDKILFSVPALFSDKIAQIVGGDTKLRTRLGEIFAELPLKWRPEHTGEFTSHRSHCSPAQAAAVANTLQAFATIIDDAADLVSQPGGFLMYMDQRIAWRQTGMPRCAVAFNLDTIPEVELAQSLTSSIPFLGPVLSGSDFIGAISAALADDVTTVPAVTAYTNRMPPCSDAELRRLQEDFPVYSALITDPRPFDTRPQLYDFIRSKLNWRREVGAGLPVCAEALEVGFLIDQIASDIAAASAFGYHDLPEDQNPYIALEAESRSALRNVMSRIADLIRSGARKDLPASADNPLPRCTDAQLETVHGYTIDHQLFPVIPNRSLPDLLEHADHVVTWRAETWAPLPPCVEAYLLGRLVSRQNGDFVTFLALAWAPGDRGSNPFHPDTRNDAANLVDLTTLVRTLDREELDRFVTEHYPAGA